MGSPRIGSLWPRWDQSSCSLRSWLGSCSVEGGVPSQLLCQPLAHSRCPSPLPGLAAFLPLGGLIMNLLPTWLWLPGVHGCLSAALGYTGPDHGRAGGARQASMSIPSLMQSTAWNAWPGREQKAKPASLGGCLLHASSEAPLDSLLNHLPHNYS